MSEFSFPCPKCKQSISCNTNIVGERINCPNCLTLVVVPPAPTTPPTITPTDKPGTIPAAGSPATHLQKTSGLAIASLICSLASAVTCIGWLPGIICGHIAKVKIRRDPALKGSGIATAGLVIGYLFLISEVSYFGIKVWQISSAMKQGFTEVQHNLSTNSIVITQSAPATNEMAPADDDTTPIEPETNVAATANVTTTTENATADANWTTDLNQMTIPGHAVGGKIHGNNFRLRRAVFRPAVLRFISANRLTVEIHGLGNLVEGKTFDVQQTDSSVKIPHVQMAWPEGVLEPSAVVSHGYTMKLQFGQAANGIVTGKIYLCLPDNSKSWIAGTFEVQMLKTN